MLILACCCYCLYRVCYLYSFLVSLSLELSGPLGMSFSATWRRQCDNKSKFIILISNSKWLCKSFKAAAADAVAAAVSN